MTAEAAVPTCHCGVTLGEGRRGAWRNFCASCWGRHLKEAQKLHERGVKRCGGCGQILSLDYFYCNRRQYSPYCRACERVRVRLRDTVGTAGIRGVLVESKRCRKCAQTKPASEFGGSALTNDRLQVLCRVCSKQRALLSVRDDDTPAEIAPLEWDYDLICLACSARSQVKWTEQRARLEVVASRFRCGACRGFVLIERADLAIGGTSAMRVHNGDSHAWRVVPSGPGRSEVKPYEQGESWW